MKKRTAPAILSLVLLFSILLCGCKAAPLPEGFSEEAVLSTAKEAIALLSVQDYDGAYELFSADMKAGLDAAGLESALGAQLKALGGFVEYKSTAVAGANNDDVGDFAVSVLVCKYENGSATYTISVDSDGLICGLFM